MKKSIILTFLLALFSTAIFAQHQLIIQKNTNGLHLVHKVKPKEGLYAIGRTYSISPQEIAAYNKIDLNEAIAIGQEILIPLTAANFSQAEQKGAPVYYIVGQKEGLYRVSQNNGTVLMADLRKWNNLSKDVITPGQKLIVGWLVPAATPVAADITADVKIDVIQQESEQRPPLEIKQEEIKTEKKVVSTTPLPIKEPVPVRIASDDGTGGYFKSLFEQQVKAMGGKKEMAATSGIFKTASGWQDTKYYALIDNLDPGTIVRISNPSNNKAIYAKVLGGMSGIRQNQGYEVRISNAAASVLEVTDTEKFVVKLNY